MDIAVTTTREFFRSISKNFVSWTLNETSLIIISVVIFFIFTSLVIYIFLNKLAQKRTQKSVFTITEASLISGILKQALEDRSSFQVSLNPESAYSLKCSLLEIGFDGLVLELPGYIKSLKEEIFGRKVYVIFSVPYKKQRIFYFFTARILRFFKRKNFLYLVLSFPSFLELRQKRNFLRIEVIPDDFEDLVVWREKFLPSGFLVDTLPKLGVPVYKKREKNFFPVVDISGLGIRLKFPANYLKAFIRKEMERGDGFVIFIKVKDEKKNRSLQFILHGIIKNIYKDPLGKFVEYGLQFVEIGKFNKDKKIILWEKVDPKTGVRDLSDWVMQKHLYYYRKGIT